MGHRYAFLLLICYLVYYPLLALYAFLLLKLRQFIVIGQLMHPKVTLQTEYLSANPTMISLYLL